MNLSKRLLSVAGFVTPGSTTIADVGTDHGYIPIYLVKNNIAQNAIAMDLNEGPLERAKNNIIANNVLNRVTTRLSDGLQELKPYEADTIIIAGMGGLLINRILADGIETARACKELILSPHSEICEVRKFLSSNSFVITDEKIMKDEGKYYFIFHVVNGIDSEYDELTYQYGKFLPFRGDTIFYEYLQKELEKREGIIKKLIKGSDNKKRLIEIQHEAELIKKGISLYECRGIN